MTSYWLWWIHLCDSISACIIGKFCTAYQFIFVGKIFCEPVNCDLQATCTLKNCRFEIANSFQFAPHNNEDTELKILFFTMQQKHMRFPNWENKPVYVISIFVPLVVEHTIKFQIFTLEISLSFPLNHLGMHSIQNGLCIPEVMCTSSEIIIVKYLD